ncbi:U2 snRNP-associated SURP motif-containing protein [Nerophis ophidion]|uniref:U2 snRNP-associated SURP motif-containing protein n=1 Tax=Nerophis ophidion TaxID=159077 RepID=UPI002ADEFEA8|nr:U2 snRNP-associated SURP motif-containing protein [Nerophis ophidion]
MKKVIKGRQSTRGSEECGVWLDTAQMKGEAKQKREQVRPISRLLNPLAKGGYGLAVALNFTQTKMQMPETKQSSIVSFFLPLHPAGKSGQRTTCSPAAEPAPEDQGSVVPGQEAEEPAEENFLGLDKVKDHQEKENSPLAWSSSQSPRPPWRPRSPVKENILSMSRTTVRWSQHGEEEEEDLAMLFTQDSEGFRVISHRGVQDPSPLEDGCRSSFEDLLFTQDTQGNMLTRFHITLEDTHGTKKTTQGTRRTHKEPQEHTRSQKSPQGARRTHKEPEEPSRSQKSPQGARRALKEPEEHTRNQKSPQGARRTHKEPEEHTRSHKNTQGTRRTHKEPEETSRSQKNPQGARRTHKEPEEHTRNQKSTQGTRITHKEPEKHTRNQKNPQGTVRTHKEPEEPTRNQKNPQGTRRTHKEPEEPTRNRKNTQGTRRARKEPEEHARIQKNTQGTVRTHKEQ